MQPTITKHPTSMQTKLTHHHLAGEWCAEFEEGLPEGFGEGQQLQAASPELTSAPAAQASLL